MTTIFKYLLINNYTCAFMVMNKKFKIFIKCLGLVFWSSGIQSTNPFYQVQLTIYNGILQEKKYHNYNQAQEYYKNGITNISLFREYGNEFAAYAYFGLSRMSEAWREIAGYRMPHAAYRISRS